MVNLIWFANENMFIVSAMSNSEREIRRLAIQKFNHFASSVC